MVLRLTWQARIDDPTYTVTCPRCDLDVEPTDPWDLGHQQDLALGGHPLGPMVPEHRSCNRRAGQQLGQQLRPRCRRRLSEWLDL